MSANRIEYNPGTGSFAFDGSEISRQELESLTATALTTPRERITVRSFSGKRRRKELPVLVEVGKVGVTINYVQQMLRFVDEYGWFTDVLDHTSDHRFDPNSPTPGHDWSVVQTLRHQARLLDRAAARLREEGLEEEALRSLVSAAFSKRFLAHNVLKTRS